MRRRESTSKPAKGSLTDAGINLIHVLPVHSRDATVSWTLPSSAPRISFVASAARTPISTVMNREVVSVRRDTSVDELTTLLLEKGLLGAPVVEEDGSLAGFISMVDLVRHRSEDGDTEETLPLRVPVRSGGSYDLGEGFHAAQLAPSTVGELMMPLAISLTESASLTMAAAVMFFEGVYEIPIVSDGEKVVGTLSALDVLGWLAREDGYPTMAAQARGGER